MNTVRYPNDALDCMHVLAQTVGVAGETVDRSGLLIYRQPRRTSHTFGQGMRARTIVRGCNMLSPVGSRE